MFDRQLAELCIVLALASAVLGPERLIGLGMAVKRYLSTWWPRPPK